MVGLINTFMIIARESSRAIAELRSLKRKSMWNRLYLKWDMLKVEVRIFLLRVMQWVAMIHNSLAIWKYHGKLVTNVKA